MNVRRSVCYLAAIICLVIVFAGAAFCEDAAAAVGGISTKLDMAYVSRYVWRGTVLNKDGAFQPSLTFSHPSGISLNWWGSLDTTNVANARDSFTESDYTLNYAWNAKKIGMNAGYVYYSFPNTSFHETQEIYASACLGGPLSPTISSNWDVDQARGAYFALAAGYCCKLPSSKAIANPMALSAKLGFATSNYNKFYFAKDQSSLVDLLLGASLPFTVSSKVTITPTINYSTVVDGGLRNSLKAAGIRADNFVAGLTFSSAF